MSKLKQCKTQTTTTTNNEWLKRGKKVVMTCPRIRNVTGNLFKPKQKDKQKKL